MNVLGLVQLCDSAVPVGGYSHFLDIERQVQDGRLRSCDDLAACVTSALEAAIAPADGVASGITFRAARHGSLDCIPDVCAALSSDKIPLEMRLCSLEMGQRLWSLSRRWSWATTIHEQFDDLACRNDLHHAVAFGALVSETTSSQIRAIATYLFNTAKTIVLAAVRAIPLDEALGLQVLSSVQPKIAQLATTYADKEPRDIVLRG